MRSASVECEGGFLAVRRVALGLLLAYVGVVGLLVAGDSFTAPTVWEGLAANGLWMVPMVGAGLLAWRRPDAALGPLSAATVAVALLNVSYVFDGRAWRSFEAAHGPVRAVVGLALCGVLGAYGYHRPLSGGVLLLVVTLGPLVLATVAIRGFGLGSLEAISSPLAVVGVLYLASIAVHRRQRAPSASPPPAPTVPPAAPAGEID